jgi:hypothetical protein
LLRLIPYECMKIKAAPKYYCYFNYCVCVTCSAGDMFYSVIAPIGSIFCNACCRRTLRRKLDEIV